MLPCPRYPATTGLSRSFDLRMRVMSSPRRAGADWTRNRQPISRLVSWSNGSGPDRDPARRVPLVGGQTPLGRAHVLIDLRGCPQPHDYRRADLVREQPGDPELGQRVTARRDPRSEPLDGREPRGGHVRPETWEVAGTRALRRLLPDVVFAGEHARGEP